jgi:predicted dehydrogenase
MVIKDPALLDASARSFADLPGGHTEGFDDSIKQTMRVIYNYIREDGISKGLPMDFASFSDGLRELQMCDAIVKSARELQWAKV